MGDIPPLLPILSSISAAEMTVLEAAVLRSGLHSGAPVPMPLATLISDVASTVAQRATLRSELFISESAALASDLAELATRTEHIMAQAKVLQRLYGVSDLDVQRAHDRLQDDESWAWIKPEGQLSPPKCLPVEPAPAPAAAPAPAPAPAPLTVSVSNFSSASSAPDQPSDQPLSEAPVFASPEVEVEDEAEGEDEGVLGQFGREMESSLPPPFIRDDILDNLATESSFQEGMGLGSISADALQSDPFLLASSATKSSPVTANDGYYDDTPIPINDLPIFDEEGVHVFAHEVDEVPGRPAPILTDPEIMALPIVEEKPKSKKKRGLFSACMRTKEIREENEENVY